MKKTILQLILLLSLCASSTNTLALSDDFYSSGEDLNYAFDADSSYVIEELEHKLRRFVLYRKLEDLLFDLYDEYPGISQ